MIRTFLVQLIRQVIAPFVFGAAITLLVSAPLLLLRRRRRAAAAPKGYPVPDPAKGY